MRILLTAFEPYADWKENSSWLTMVDLLRELPTSMQLITRRYPVDFEALQERLKQDLNQNYDAVLHLGQAPGATAIKLEMVALNVAGRVRQKGEALPSIAPDGPLAFHSEMPVARWIKLLRDQQIPAVASYHAGTFLCNAVMYLSHHWFQDAAHRPPIGFVHLPLATQQVAAGGHPLASLPTTVMADAVRMLLEDLSRTRADASQA